MNDVTRILNRLGDGHQLELASAQLLPLVYEELRTLAAAKMAQERSGQTLQATALVHEAYLRLIGDNEATQQWESRRHFFAAAAEAMRRILIDEARRKLRPKHGGNRRRVDVTQIDVATDTPPAELVAVNGALDALAVAEPQKAELVKLRYFAGFTIDEAAELLGISRATAKRHWAYARAWLFCQLEDDQHSA